MIKKLMCKIIGHKVRTFYNPSEFGYFDILTFKCIRCRAENPPIFKPKPQTSQTITE